VTVEQAGGGHEADVVLGLVQLGHRGPSENSWMSY
jgi:hypothetical protein